MGVLSLKRVLVTVAVVVLLIASSTFLLSLRSSHPHLRGSREEGSRAGKLGAWWSWVKLQTMHPSREQVRKMRGLPSLKKEPHSADGTLNSQRKHTQVPEDVVHGNRMGTEEGSPPHHGKEEKGDGDEEGSRRGVDRGGKEEHLQTLSRNEDKDGHAAPAAAMTTTTTTTAGESRSIAQAEIQKDTTTLLDKGDAAAVHEKNETERSVDSNAAAPALESRNVNPDDAGGENAAVEALLHRLEELKNEQGKQRLQREQEAIPTVGNRGLPASDNAGNTELGTQASAVADASDAAPSNTVRQDDSSNSKGDDGDDDTNNKEEFPYHPIGLSNGNDDDDADGDEDARDRSGADDEGAANHDSGNHLNAKQQQPKASRDDGDDINVVTTCRPNKDRACKCPKHCHECVDIRVQGQTQDLVDDTESKKAASGASDVQLVGRCTVCRAKQYLFQDKCVSTCPLTHIEKGLGDFNRLCVPDETRARAQSLHEGTGTFQRDEGGQSLHNIRSSLTDNEGDESREEESFVSLLERLKKKSALSDEASSSSSLSSSESFSADGSLSSKDHGAIDHCDLCRDCKEGACFCHSREKTRMHCSMCTNFKYLLHGQCVDKCPPHEFHPRGLARFGRECVERISEKSESGYFNNDLSSDLAERETGKVGSRNNRAGVEGGNPVAKAGGDGKPRTHTILWGLDEELIRQASIKINVGDTVRWEFQGNHGVTSGYPGRNDGKFSSKSIGSISTYSHRFSEEGVYPYYCRSHGGRMQAQITVGDVNVQETRLSYVLVYEGMDGASRQPLRFETAMKPSFILADKKGTDLEDCKQLCNTFMDACKGIFYYRVQKRCRALSNTGNVGVDTEIKADSYARIETAHDIKHVS